jgi:hypothetical protein
MSPMVINLEETLIRQELIRRENFEPAYFSEDSGFISAFSIQEENEVWAIRIGNIWEN